MTKSHKFTLITIETGECGTRKQSSLSPRWEKSNQGATGELVPFPEDVRNIADRKRGRVQEYIPVRALIFKPLRIPNQIYNFQASGSVLGGEK